MFNTAQKFGIALVAANVALSVYPLYNTNAKPTDPLFVALMATNVFYAGYAIGRRRDINIKFIDTRFS
jgi:hypothetical protein